MVRWPGKEIVHTKMNHCIISRCKKATLFVKQIRHFLDCTGNRSYSMVLFVASIQRPVASIQWPVSDTTGQRLPQADVSWRTCKLHLPTVSCHLPRLSRTLLKNSKTNKSKDSQSITSNCCQLRQKSPGAGDVSNMAVWLRLLRRSRGTAKRLYT